MGAVTSNGTFNVDFDENMFKPSDINQRMYEQLFDIQMRLDETN